MALELTCVCTKAHIAEGQFKCLRRDLHRFRPTWTACDHLSPPVIYKVPSFALTLAECFGGVGFTRGFRLRFSFHNDTALPQPLPDGTWNCSVPHWPDFRQHVLCNFKTECAGGEDEAPCPYTTQRCGQGRISIGDSCYIYVAPDHKISWLDADKSCRMKGAALASLKSAGEWRRVYYTLRRELFANRPLFIGIQSSSKELPVM